MMRRIKKCLASLMAACLLLGLAVLPASSAAADYPDLPPEGGLVPRRPDGRGG